MQQNIHRYQGTDLLLQLGVDPRCECSSESRIDNATKIPWGIPLRDSPTGLPSGTPPGDFCQAIRDYPQRQADLLNQAIYRGFHDPKTATPYSALPRDSGKCTLFECAKVCINCTCSPAHLLGLNQEMSVLETFTNQPW